MHGLFFDQQHGEFARRNPFGDLLNRQRVSVLLDAAARDLGTRLLLQLLTEGSLVPLIAFEKSGSGGVEVQLETDGRR